MSIHCRADKEALENNLFDAQTVAAALEAKKEQLEESNQASMMKNEALQGSSLFLFDYLISLLVFCQVNISFYIYYKILLYY